MRTNVILDTGPLVALFNSNDAFHLWTIETLAPMTARRVEIRRAHV